jgi:CHAT domain-containing protein
VTVAANVIDAATVTYGADLPSHANPPESHAALVLSDPNGNLAAARDEGRDVASALARSWNVVSLEGEDATSAAVRDALAHADLFHFAGHGRAAGRAGWSSAMPLASGQLSLGDILALPRAPARVVLSACDGAHTGGMSLAQAFLVAGSRAVVASTRPVRDDVARAITSALYESLVADPHADLASALRDAQLAVRTRIPDADWSAFRALAH